MASQINTKLAKLNAAINAATTDKARVATYKGFVDAFAAAQEGMKAITFPIPIRPDVDRLLFAYASLQAEFEKLAHDPSYDPGQAINEADAEGTYRATRIRAFLGLPPS